MKQQSKEEFQRQIKLCMANIQSAHVDINNAIENHLIASNGGYAILDAEGEYIALDSDLVDADGNDNYNHGKPLRMAMYYRRMMMSSY